VRCMSDSLWQALSNVERTAGKPMVKGQVTESGRRTSERRASRRCKFTQLMRIRPSDPERMHFDDMRKSISVSRTGVYFHTTETGYEVGMRLFLIMPYTNEPASGNREYLAEVVRMDPLPNGTMGIGVKLLLEVGPQHQYSFEPPAPKRG